MEGEYKEEEVSPLDEVQKASIVRRIEFIEEEIADLKEYEALNFDTYSVDRKKRRDVERIIENVANAVIDIGKILLVGQETALPDTYREIFSALKQSGVIDEELSVRLSDLARLRNVLAHQYLDIKWDLIRDFLQDGKNAVVEFLRVTKKMI